MPIDDKGMDRRLMTAEETAMYESYQKDVYESLAPELSDDERKWLSEYAGLSKKEEAER